MCTLIYKISYLWKLTFIFVKKMYILKIQFLRCRPVIQVFIHLHNILFGDFENKAKSNTE